MIATIENGIVTEHAKPIKNGQSTMKKCERNAEPKNR